jgi:hypothetical protein
MAGLEPHLGMGEAEMRHANSYVRLVANAIPRLLRCGAVIAKTIRLDDQSQIWPEEVDFEPVHVAACQRPLDYKIHQPMKFTPYRRPRGDNAGRGGPPGPPRSSAYLARGSQRGPGKQAVDRVRESVRLLGLEGDGYVRTGG